MLAGLEKPTKGEIVIAGQHIEKLNENQLVAFRRERVGFIFQSYNLLGTMNAVENVALPLSFRGVPRGRRREMAEKYLKMVGLEKGGDHMPNQMSGGQQQRVGIARALVVHPEIIFADEPTGSVILVQHYPKTTPVIFWSLSILISLMTERQSVRFSSRVKFS